MRRMISPKLGSFTRSAACAAESHLTTRSCFSGHCLLWRLTSRAKTRTAQRTTAPFVSRQAQVLGDQTKELGQSIIQGASEAARTTLRETAESSRRQSAAA